MNQYHVKVWAAGVKAGSSVCTLCNERKPMSDDKAVSQFYPSNPYWCKKCSRIKNDARRRRPDVVAKDRELYKRKVAAKPEVYQAIRLKTRCKRYGITVDRFNRTRAFQGDHCAICLDPLSDPFAIDHKHGGSFRGLLCLSCNTTLGRIEQRPWMADNFVEYLRVGGTASEVPA